MGSSRQHHWRLQDGPPCGELILVSRGPAELASHLSVTRQPGIVTASTLDRLLCAASCAARAMHSPMPIANAIA